MCGGTYQTDAPATRSSHSNDIVISVDIVRQRDLSGSAMISRSFADMVA